MMSYKTFMQGERAKKKTLKKNLVGILRTYYPGSEEYAKQNAKKILAMLDRKGVV